MSSDKPIQSAARKALDGAIRKAPARPNPTKIEEILARQREEDLRRANVHRLHAGRPAPRALEQIPTNPLPLSVHPVGKIPQNTAFPCEDSDIHSTLATYITTDGGGSSGADYYNNRFDSEKDNLRNASIQSDGQTWQIGYRPPPPIPVSFDSKSSSIQDVYIYFDSAAKDQSSNPTVGQYIWSVSTINNANQPIQRIIEMEISEFFVPDILTLPTKPAYFFFGRMNLQLFEATTQAIYGPDRTKFHWEFDVQPAGISKRLIPLRRKFIFGQPLRELSQATFNFTSPLKTTVFDQDTYLNCSPIIGTNPGIIDLGANHNLGGPGFVANPPRAIQAVPGGAGFLGAGQYSWVVTYLVGANETSATLLGDIYLAGTFNAQQASLSEIPIGQAGVTGRRIYRTPSFNGTNPPGYFLVTTIADNTTTVFVDNVADGGLGASLPLVNNTGLTTEVSIFITGFSSDTPVDAIVNDVDGQLASVQGARTLVLNNTPGANFDLSGLFPVTPVAPFRTIIGYRRLLFSIRFRSLTGTETNHITPV
jgi:hypothetical protein